jgi:hypothetical protein
MAAKRQEITRIQESMFLCLSWLEATCEQPCFLLDVDMDTGILALYGTKMNTTDFRNKFQKMMKGVY